MASRAESLSARSTAACPRWTGLQRAIVPIRPVSAMDLSRAQLIPELGPAVNRRRDLARALYSALLERAMSTPYDEAFAEFLAGAPDYARTTIVDEVRAREFGRLDRAGHVYLDYTGSGLYGESQVRRHAEMLLGKVLGNPHSSN